MQVLRSSNAFCSTRSFSAVKTVRTWVCSPGGELRHCTARPRRVVQRKPIMSRKTVLIDMDNTLAQFDLEFGKRWVAAYPAASLDTITSRKHFELEQNFPDDPAAKEAAIKIMSTPGLFIAFEPAAGSVAAIREMVDSGLKVFFCTAPLPFQYESCVAEKYAWVRKHFGDDYLSKIIITRDKTVIKGDVLIDDKPRVSGACEKPEWTHILYTQSYNMDVTDKPRFTVWKDWRGILGKYIDL